VLLEMGDILISSLSPYDLYLAPIEESRALFLKLFFSQGEPFVVELGRPVLLLHRHHVTFAVAHHRIAIRASGMRQRLESVVGQGLLKFFDFEVAELDFLFFLFQLDIHNFDFLLVGLRLLGELFCFRFEVFVESSFLQLQGLDVRSDQVTLSQARSNSVGEGLVRLPLFREAVLPTFFFFNC